MSDIVTIALVSAGAALLASAITACASLGVVLLQEHRRRKAAKEDAFFAAAEVVLSKGLTMVDRSRLWSGLLQGHSQPAGGLAVLLRLRYPVDPAAILEPLIKDQEEIHFAGAHVALHGDQETVALCNNVLHAANGLAVAMLPGQRTGITGRLQSVAKGLPTPDVDRARAAAADLGKARKAFADHLRQLSDREQIDVYAVAPD